MKRGLHQVGSSLEKWFGPRSESIARIAQAHIDLGEVEGPGRPLELGRPLAHAYVIRVVAEFQGFARDLYDLSCEHLVTLAAPPDGLVALLTTAMTRGRALDVGVAELRRQGFSDTLSWARQQVPVLNRAARALDRIMWDYLRHRTGDQPW